MVDKQIIIDDQKKTIHRLQDECTEKTNAIIALGEQLKAKEQECEELKKQIKYEFDETLLQYSNELDRLGAENDDLKEYIIHLHNLCGNETDKQYKYKQTLTEIKEIAENGCYDDCGMPLDELSIILQKISECEVEDGV